MPSRRAAALAQALTLILLLAPGLPEGTPASVQAALRPAQADPPTIFDATGKGIGCEVGKRTFKGPAKPKDPPWPPGTKPRATPQPTPAAIPDTSDGPAASGAPVPDGTAEEPTAHEPTMLLAGTGARVAQADSSAESTEVPAAAEPDTAEPAADPDPVAEPDPAEPDDGDVDLEPDVATDSATRREGRRSRLIQGIDVSRYQEGIDYELVRKAGKRFVLIKATEDHAWIDPWFATNLERARAAGLAVGAYHVFDYTLDGTAQADHFVDQVEANRGIDGALPPVVDVECWRYRGSSTHVVSEARLRDFVKRVYERTGRLPIVYTSVFMWNQVVGNAEGFEDLPLWAACWGCDSQPALPPGWDDWAFWQWQPGNSRVRGINRFDRNFFRGDRAELDAMRLRPFSIEAGAAVTASRRVELDLGGRDATHYRTSPDGEEWSRWIRVRSVPEVELAPEEGEQSVYVQLRVRPELVSPILSDSIMLDRSGPELSEPAVSLRLGPVGETSPSLPVSVSWTAIDPHAGLSDATVSIACGDERAERLEVSGSGAPDELVTWDALATIALEASCSITAIGRDGVGNTSRSTLRDIETMVLPATADDAASATVSGFQVGVIARRGPDAGRATVMLDGAALGLVDLYAPVAGIPEVVFVADLVPGASQEVTVESTGTANPASTGTDVAIDGFVTLARADVP